MPDEPDLDPAAVMLARWITSTRSDADHMTNLLESTGYARLWYGAREAGEHLRAQVLDWLYTHRGAPGGPHPDPRQPSAFSAQATIGIAARLLGLHIWQAPEALAHQADQLNGGLPVYAWLFTYPDHRPPELCVRVTVRQTETLFQMAMLIGYIARERATLLDPDAPAGLHVLPTDEALVSVLHQFANAFLAWGPECPPTWHCRCNALRRRYNTVPPDHAQPTDALEIAEMRRIAALRERTSQQQQPLSQASQQWYNQEWGLPHDRQNPNQNPNQNQNPNGPRKPFGA